VLGIHELLAELNRVLVSHKVFHVFVEE
jgi:hypothetical protein